MNKEFIIRPKRSEIVVKSNHLIESKIKRKLTPIESCLMVIILSKIKKDDQSFRIFSITVKEFSKLAGYKKSSDIYEKLRLAGKSLTINPLEIQTSTGGILYTTWLSGAEYRPGEGLLEITIEPRLEPYLLELRERFTILELKKLIKLRDPNTIRIYELLKQYETVKKRTIMVSELKDYLGIGDKYEEYYNFKKRILKASIEKINRETELFIEFEEIKKSRKVVGLEFSIKKKISRSYVASDDGLVGLERLGFV